MTSSVVPLEAQVLRNEAENVRVFLNLKMQKRQFCNLVRHDIIFERLVSSKTF